MRYVRVNLVILSAKQLLDLILDLNNIQEAQDALKGWTERQAKKKAIIRH